MPITTLMEGHDAERDFFILVVLAFVYEESYSTSKLFVAARLPPCPDENGY
jgi:hypothetical protein